MPYVPRMISVEPSQSRWIDSERINVSKFVREAIEIAAEEDSHSIADVVAKLRIVNKKLQELLAAYQLDARTVKERV